MYINGHIDVAGQVKNLKFDQRATDPVSPALSQSWFNTAELALKYYDGVSVQILATGSGALAEYLKLDGSTPMTGDLVLSSDDQTAAVDEAAVSKGYLTAGLNTKQNTITGAASTVVTDNLDNSKAVVSNGSGKLVSATNTTSAEIEYLAGVTSAIQDQLDSKQGDLGYTPLNKAGDSMSGTLAMNNNEITGVGAPLAPNSAARLIDVQNLAAGLDFQADVVGLESDFVGEPGRYIYIDGTEFTTGATAASGDIVVVDASGEILSVAYDISVSGANGALTWSETGEVWLALAEGVWAPFGGLAGVNAGVGLRKDGNTLHANLGAGIAELPTDEIGIDVLSTGGLFTTVDGTTSSTATGAQLSVKLDGDALALSGSGLTIAPNGVEVAHIDASVFGDGLQGGSGVTVSVQAVADGGILVGAGGIEVDDVELRTRVLYLDGAQAMTGTLTLSSADQSAAANTAAVSKGYVQGLISTASGAVDALETRLEGGYFLYEELVTASTTHTVEHNMGTQFVSVLVIDDTNEQVIPQSVTFTTANTLIVTFYTAQTCRIVVTGLKN